MPKRRSATWRTTVEHRGVTVHVYERTPGGVLYRMVSLPGVERSQKSLKTRDREYALQYAEELAEALADGQNLGLTANPTWKVLFDTYFRERSGQLKASWLRAAQTRRKLFEECFGSGTRVRDLSQYHVDRFVRARRAGDLAPDRKGKESTGVSDRTVDADMTWLRTVLRWAARYRRSGQLLLGENPLTGLKWPKEKNTRRPVASHARYVKTQEFTDQVDELGRLRLILALLRMTGRRITSVCKLRRSDLLLKPEEIRAALAGMGFDEGRADHMPNGAIRWRAENDKVGFDSIAPLSSAALEEVSRYLSRSSQIGEAWLFPAPKDPTKPVSRYLVRTWLGKAEAKAKLPKLAGGLFHPYRRLWASERKHLPDVDVAVAGGWKDATTMKRSYQQADPETILRVVELTGG